MKKKFIFFISLIFLFFIIHLSFVSAAEITCAKKDVNSDGKIDILDLITVRGNLNQEVTIKNSKSDVNADGKIDILDLIAVRGSLNEKCSGREVAIEGACKKDSKETAEGPGGTYCEHDDYEECYDYKTKSTAIAYNCDLFPLNCYEVDRATDFCSGNTLNEAWLNCGITTLTSDAVHYKDKNCNDYDGEGGWEYYCTSNQVRKKERDFGCGDGECEFIGWKNDQLVSQNGDDSYCKDRKNSGCSLCTHNQYDCDADSECSGSLVCKGPIIGSDGCCFSDETWDTTNKKCIECTGGVCCDGNGQFRPSSYGCDSHISGTDQYRCEGNTLGDDEHKRYQKQFCSGSSSSCDGSKSYIEGFVSKDCTSTQFCEGATTWSSSTRNCKTAQCTSGDCCDTSPGKYTFRPITYACITGLTWYGCPWREELGSDVGKKTATRYCNGYQNACNGQMVFGPWSIKQDCSSTQYCTGSEGPNELWCRNIVCSLDSNCGGCSFNYFCQNNDKWQEATCGKCNNPGTKSSFCSKVTNNQLYDDCGDTIFGTWSNYCKGSELWKKRTNQLKGCANNDCFSDQQVEDVKIKSCTKGCSNGVCNEDACTEECSVGELRCWGDYKQTCGNYDADVCKEWPASTSGSGNELCQYGCANDACKPNPITCTKNSDCGTDAWTGNTFCSSGDVYQKWRTYTCNNPGTTSSSCTYSDTDKKKTDCDGTFGCSNGACQITSTARINLKTGNNLFSLPRNKQVSFNQLITNCNVVSESGRVDLAYYIPANNIDSSNYKFIILNNVLYPGQGYFIKVSNDCYIDIEGGRILSSELGFENSGFSGNGLRTGWNLIGSPSLSTTFSPGTCQLYDNIGILKYGYNVNSCSQVSGWNGIYQDCNIQNGISRCKCSVNSFEPGLGYWIRTKNDCKLS